MLKQLREKKKKKKKKTHTNQLGIGFMNPCRSTYKPTQEICIYIMG